SGAGLDLLTAALTEYFQSAQVHGWLHLSPRAGAVRSSLFELGCVLSEQVDEQGDWWLEVRMARRDVDRLTGDPEQGVRFHPADVHDLLAGTA
ncbi:MAG: hypothetical protein OEU44_06615, partial [Gammaproteobacteria bacterium]|nr:hypothetical protein [Gammaproteobacteria bacterium]